MRINKFVASATGLSRRTADTAVQAGRVTINGRRAAAGDDAGDNDSVRLDGRLIAAPAGHLTLIFHKPAGYVCSRQGQGSRTIYDLLPAEYRRLKPVGRLDKDSSGLLLLTDDGDLAHRLAHPSFNKTKVYDATLDRGLTPDHRHLISGQGVPLDDGPSRLGLTESDDTGLHWRITMHEGRNRQIRRTFAALNYRVTALHRTTFGDYELGGLRPGQCMPAGQRPGGR